MAIITPTLNEILQGNDRPSDGELLLLELLIKYLDESYEVYFHPFINGDRLDIVLMRKHYGVLIIEEKDWRLKNFEIINAGVWKVFEDGRNIKSPFAQVREYKQNFYELHIPELYEKKLLNYAHIGIINSAVFFSKVSNAELLEIENAEIENDTVALSIGKEKVLMFGGVELSLQTIENILIHSKLKSDRISNLFDQRMYDNFKEVLKPRTIISPHGIRIGLTDNQNKNARSESGEYKMKGYAGSGKTVVIAQRAINAHTRTKKRVLILCYNITLKNFILERIEYLAQDYNKNFYYVDNYHQFIMKVLNYLNIPISIPPDKIQGTVSAYLENEYFSNLKLFEKHINMIAKYSVIIIDEAQDYKKEWLDIIKKCFLAHGGEFFVVGDAKQNIYSNQMTGKDFTTNVPGNFRRLNKCWRSDPALLKVFEDFQLKLLNTKYEHDELSNSLEPELYEKQKSDIEYIELSHFDARQILDYIASKVKELKSTLEDNVILGNHIPQLRRLEAYYRHRSNKNAVTTFESAEQYLKLLLGITLNIPKNPPPEIVLLKKLYSKIKEHHRNRFVELITLKILAKQYNEKSITSKLIRIQEMVPNDLNDKTDDFLNFISIKEEIFKEKSVKTHFDRELEKLRQNKKNFFSITKGCISMSTIHSFKGWEAQNVFVIIDQEFTNNKSEDVFNELVYTAITRAKSNLFIINLDNKRLSSMVPQFLGSLNKL